MNYILKLIFHLKETETVSFIFFHKKTNNEAFIFLSQTNFDLVESVLFLKCIDFASNEMEAYLF